MSSDGRRFGRGVGAALGQTTSEYVVLTALVTAAASVAAALLGGSIRQAFFDVAQRVLGVVTGS